jgi:hypothetical protein
MTRISRRTWTGVGAGVAALVLAAGVVGAVSALSDDGDSGDDTVVVAKAKQGDGEIETTTSAEHDMEHGEDGHDDGTHDDGTHDDGTHDDGTHDDGTHDDGTHDDGTHDDGTHDDGTHDDGHDDGHDNGNGGTTPDPCNGGGGHGHSIARAACPKPPDPCKDTSHQHSTGRAKCPDPDPDPDPDPCDDDPHQHALSTSGADDCEPDPCEGHVHNTNPDDPCNPDPCDDTHQHAAATADGSDCEPDPCEGHVHNTNPDDPCNPDPCDDTHQHGAATAGESCPDDVVQYEDLSPEVQALVDQGTAVALQYPTAAQAQAAGWGKITIYFPGIAQHNLKSPILDSTFDPANPEVLLYGQDGQLVGINYIVRNIGGPPEGFPGDDDHWHEHPSLCLSLTTGLVIGGENLSVQECAAIGGFVINFQNFWLLHVWTIPGYDSPEGVFSHENSKV